MEQEVKLHTTLGLCFDMGIMVALHSVQEFLTAFGVSDVLGTDVDALLDVSISNDFVHNDTDGIWSYIIYDSSAAGWMDGI